ncbi:hypothetical protein [Thiocystis minor]|uniref:hypothetical protein n=1 Tax=Thiocystis minor TaxID=61597 RepID=UPI0019125F63|nr:hypothetical protein [Thiocystis minor]
MMNQQFPLAAERHDDEESGPWLKIGRRAGTSLRSSAAIELACSPLEDDTASMIDHGT